MQWWRPSSYRALRGSVVGLPALIFDAGHMAADVAALGLPATLIATSPTARVGVPMAPIAPKFGLRLGGADHAGSCGSW
ncbi:MAG: hypothetical protein R2709_14390 [Marmoricola sp.]